METRDLAAGVLLAGFNGISGSSGGVLDDLRSFPVGGVILLAQNVVTLSQTRSLTDDIRTLFAGQPDPLIAIDQEGGRVVRLHDGVVHLPPMMALGATGNRELARRAGSELGTDLRRAGVNITLGPVLDLAIFPQNTVIGTRSFGGDPAAVATLAGAFADGMAASGVMAAFKHFPGHGATDVDSNAALPVITEDPATLRARDFVPFARLLPRAKAVMTAHMVIKSMDPAHPVTTSRLIVHDLLRDELGFRGACISDCLQMDAMTKSIGSSEAAIQALAAGVDCLLVSRSLALARAMAQAIARAVDSGRLPRARLEEAYERVLTLRRATNAPLPLDAPRPDPRVGADIALASITALRGSPRADPQATIVLSFEGTMYARGTAGLISRHYSVTAGRKIPEIRLPLEPAPTVVDNALAHVAAVGLRPIILMRRAHIYPTQARAVERLVRDHPDAIVVSMLEPYDALDATYAAHVVCAYGDEELSIQALASVLFDGAPARGRLPVHIPAA